MALSACTAPPQAYACATDDEPPIAVESMRCPADRTYDEPVEGVRWYSAPEHDVSEPDEVPVIGQPLDGDWWDWRERADVNDKKTWSKAKSTKKPEPTKKATATKKPKPTN